MTEEEQRILEVISLPNRKDRFQSEKFKDGVPKGYRNDKDDEQEQNVYYVPLLWATNLVNKAFVEGRFAEKSDRRILIQVSDDFTRHAVKIDCSNGVLLPKIKKDRYVSLATSPLAFGVIYHPLYSRLLAVLILSKKMWSLYSFTHSKIMDWVSKFKKLMCPGLRPFGLIRQSGV